MIRSTPIFMVRSAVALFTDLARAILMLISGSGTGE